MMMSNTDIPITLETAAMLLLARLHRYEWHISLKPDGDLYIVVGDDPPGMSPAQAFEGIRLLTDQIGMLLSASDAPARVH